MSEEHDLLPKLHHADGDFITLDHAIGPQRLQVSLVRRVRSALRPPKLGLHLSLNATCLLHSKIATQELQG